MPSLPSVKSNLFLKVNTHKLAGLDASCNESPSITWEMGLAMNHGIFLASGQERDYWNLRVVVVLVRNGETEDQAWRRHLTENPTDRRADIKIYHFAWPPG